MLASALEALHSLEITRDLQPQQLIQKTGSKIDIKCNETSRQWLALFLEVVSGGEGELGEGEGSGEGAGGGVVTSTVVTFGELLLVTLIVKFCPKAALILVCIAEVTCEVFAEPMELLTESPV